MNDQNNNDEKRNRRLIPGNKKKTEERGDMGLKWRRRKESTISSVGKTNPSTDVYDIIYFPFTLHCAMMDAWLLPWTDLELFCSALEWSRSQSRSNTPVDCKDRSSPRFQAPLGGSFRILQSRWKKKEEMISSKNGKKTRDGHDPADRRMDE